MKTLGILLAVIVVGIVAYRLAYPTTVYRFRITLNVETPRGLKTGSSVMEVRHRSYPAWTTLGNNTGQSTLTGEAVFVDLGAGDDGRQKNLVAILVYGQRGDHSLGFVPGIVFAPLWKGKSTARGTAYELSSLPAGTRAKLPSDLTPTLITFLDVSDPNTARAVPQTMLKACWVAIRISLALSLKWLRQEASRLTCLGSEVFQSQGESKRIFLGWTAPIVLQSRH